MKELNQNSLSYIPGLNGIRALSALLVVSTHWPGNMLSLKFGWIGVNIFFVLSGFLITRILLVEKVGQSFKNFITHFYYKRSLRIFPLYYAFIVVSALLVFAITILFPNTLNNEIWKGAYLGVTKDIAYYLTYTYNIKINLRYFFGWTDSSNQFFGHLWSLAVEEQFYLVFPFIVYFASIRNLKRIVIGLLILCPLIRLWACIYGVEIVTDKYWLGEFLYSNTLCQADALATGAALALFNFKVKKPYLMFFIIFGIWCIIGIIHLILLRKAGYFLVEGKSLGYNFPGFWLMQPTEYFLINIRAFYLYSLVNLLAFSLILPATLKAPLFPKVFEQKRIDYLGKISYGVYVFHNPLIAIMLIVLGNLGLSNNFNTNPIFQIFIFIFYLGIVILLSHLSFKYFEKKIIALKHNKVVNSTENVN